MTSQCHGAHVSTQKLAGGREPSTAATTSRVGAIRSVLLCTSLVFLVAVPASLCAAVYGVSMAGLQSLPPTCGQLDGTAQLPENHAKKERPPRDNCERFRQSYEVQLGALDAEDRAAMFKYLDEPFPVTFRLVGPRRPNKQQPKGTANPWLRIRRIIITYAHTKGTVNPGYPSTIHP